MPETVSVIIATYNRPEHCRRAIDSVMVQTYQPIEVIVVDDCSNPPFQDPRVKVLRTEQNTRSMFGWASPGFVRTLGMKEATGEYIAFLDDDDSWLPDKLERQLDALRTSGNGASCSDALIGCGQYDLNTSYPRMMADFFFNEIRHILASKGCFDIENGFPAYFSTDLLTKHNLVITSSVIVRRDILEKIGYMKTVPLGQEDYSCWLDVSKYTDFTFISTPCLFYDSTPSNNR